MSPGAFIIYHDPKLNHYAIYSRGTSMLTGWCSSLNTLMYSKAKQHPVSRSYLCDYFPLATAVAITTDLTTLPTSHPELFL